MSKKVKVAAIQIQYPDGSVKQVSVEDARELHCQLNELFGSPASPAPIIIERDRVVERDRWPWWYDDVTCGDVPGTLQAPPALPQIWCCAE